MNALDLKKMSSVITSKTAEVCAPVINAACMEFMISSRQRQAAFMTTLLVESDHLRANSENLNYRPDALLATFNNSKITRFTREQAQQYGRTNEHPADQVMIANIAYANRMGNGDVESGDGFKNRGAGWIQLTGADNHAACAKAFGIPRDQIGDWLRTLEGSARSAAWFWRVNQLNMLADKGDFDKVCDVVNIGRQTPRIGDAIGYTERLTLYRKTLAIIV